jgi:hypothetical protein
MIWFACVFGLCCGIIAQLIAAQNSAAVKRSEAKVISTAARLQNAAQAATKKAAHPAFLSKPGASLLPMRGPNPVGSKDRDLANKRTVTAEEKRALLDGHHRLDTQFDCSSAVPISCGGVINGNNTNGTHLVSLYNCVPWNESGPENMYVLTTTVTTTISAELSNMTGGNLDVFILNACDDAACIEYGAVAAIANCVFAGTYYIMVDGYYGSVSPYTLTVSCTECGEPLENDECANAIGLTCGTTEEIVDLAGATNSCPTVHGYPDAWYKFYLDPAISACWNVAISYCGTDASLTNIGVVLENDCACNDYVTITRSSSAYCSSPSWLPEYFYWDSLTAGWWYLPVFANPAVTVVFDLSCEPCPPPPANDLCENAVVLAVPASVQGTTAGATNDNTMLCSETQTAPGVWYTVVGTGHTMTASLCNTSPSWDSKITIACGSCGEFTCVAYIDDYCGVLSQVSWCSEAGTAYYILVHGYSTDTGAFTLDVTDDGVPCAPTVPCRCPQVSDLTAYPVGTDISLHWTAANLGVYKIWMTTRTNPSGEPPSDPNWDLIATRPVMMAGTQAYLDPVGGDFRKRYVVTYECGASGRCCYGELENPSCGDWPRVLCNYFGGTWTSGLTCATTCPTGCNITCPPGAILEGEPCPNSPDTTNAGCNSSPYVFSQIACGQTVCGTAYSSSSTRDTDWYLFTTTGWNIIRARGTGELPLQILIINLNNWCPVTNNDVIAWVQTPQCVEGTCQTSCVAAGTYALWCGCSEFADHPCSDYVLTLECEPCTPPACTPDFQITGTGTVSGNTCGADNNCNSMPSEEQIVQVTITQAGTYTFSLCPEGTWDTYMFLDATCCATTHIAFNDDYCGTTSQITQQLNLGTYYVTIEGWSSTACGEWTLTITEALVCVPDFNMTAPGSVSGNTCGALSDCATRASEDQIVAVTIPAAGAYTFSLCNPQATWDTYMYLDATCCASSHLTDSDDYCSTASQFSYTFGAAGTYYVLIESYYSSGVCGAWTLNVTSP